MRYRCRSQLWEHTGEAAWHFVTLPPDIADEIEEITAPDRRGFGSVRVTATIGSATWATSLFPDKAAGSYVLPVKKQIREAEGIADGDAVEVTIELEMR